MFLRISLDIFKKTKEKKDRAILRSPAVSKVEVGSSMTPWRADLDFFTHVG